MKKFLWYWLPVFAYMGFIFYLSSRSSFPVEAPPWAFFADKIVHAGLFGFLAFLFLRAWTEGNFASLTLPALIGGAIFASLYGITDEVHQMYVPNRAPDINDWIADTLGAIAVCILLYFLYTRRDLDMKAEAAQIGS